MALGQAQHTLWGNSRLRHRRGEQLNGQPLERGETKDRPLELDVFVFALDCNNCRAERAPEDPPKATLTSILT